MRETAEQFFDACETGKGWDGCAPYCHPGATFAGQTAALAGIDTLEAYTEWMKDLLTPLPDGTAEVRSFAVDEVRHNVAAYGIFRGTHTGDFMGIPASGKPVEMRSIDIWRIEDGMFVEHWDELNLMEMFQQMGALPPLGAGLDRGA